MEQTLELQVLDTNAQVIDKNGNVTLQNLTPAETSKYELNAANIEETNPNSTLVLSYKIHWLHKVIAF